MVNFINGLHGQASASDNWVKPETTRTFQQYYSQSGCFTDGSTPISEFTGKLQTIMGKANSDELGAVLGKTASGQRTLQNLRDAVSLASDYSRERSNINIDKFSNAIKTYNKNVEAKKVEKYMQEINSGINQFNSDKLVSQYNEYSDGRKVATAWYTMVAGSNYSTIAQLKSYVQSLKNFCESKSDQIDGRKSSALFPDITEENNPTG